MTLGPGREASAGKANRAALTKLASLFEEPLDVISAGEEDREKIGGQLKEKADKIYNFIFNGKTIGTTAGNVKYSQLTNMEKLYAASVLYEQQNSLENFDKALGTSCFFSASIRKKAAQEKGRLKNKLNNNDLF